MSDKQHRQPEPLSFKDKYALNELTAFNKQKVMAADHCGCFYCGRIFPSSEVTSWMSEKHGEDTALCPYCNADTLIIPTEKHPLSTYLLTELYVKWFMDEYSCNPYENFKSAEAAKMAGFCFLDKSDPIYCSLLKDDIGNTSGIAHMTVFGTVFKHRNSCWGYGKEDDLTNEKHSSSDEDLYRHLVEGSIIKLEVCNEALSYFNDEGARIPVEYFRQDDLTITLKVAKRITSGEELQAVVTGVSSSDFTMPEDKDFHATVYFYEIDIETMG